MRGDGLTAMGAGENPTRPGPVHVVLKGYPRLSETFIAQEIRGLERRGLDIRIISLRRPTDPACHPVHGEIAAPVTYLPEYLYQAPLQVIAAWRRVRRLPGYSAARRTFLRDLWRDPSSGRLRRFGQACVLAAGIADGCEDTSGDAAGRLHFHFLHTPASVTRYAALLTGLPWSGSAHAKDIWTTPEWDLRDKLAEAEWVAACTADGAARLRALTDGAAHTTPLIYHGLDLIRFPAPPDDRDAANGRNDRNGRNAEDPVRLFSVGRAVAKKGYDDMLAALAMLPEGLCWRLRHIGDGPLAESLKRRAVALGLGGRIDWLGARTQAHVLDEMRRADIFVMAGKITPDGDRDGLPNVLMEAQSQRLAVVATSVGAVGELIRDQETGLLSPPGAPEKLSAHLARLITDPALRATLGMAGERRVRRDFDAERLLDDLAVRFGLMPEGKGAS